MSRTRSLWSGYTAICMSPGTGKAHGLNFLCMNFALMRFPGIAFWLCVSVQLFCPCDAMYHSKEIHDRKSFPT